MNQPSLTKAASSGPSYSYPNLLMGNSASAVLPNLSATSSGGASYPTLNSGGVQSSAVGNQFS